MPYFGTELQYMPGEPRPTGADAFVQLINTIQARQEMNRRQQALAQQQQMQAQKESDQRTREDTQGAQERQDQADQAIADQYNSWSLDQQKAAYGKLPPGVRRLVPDPSLAPDPRPEPAKPMTEYERASLTRRDREHKDTETYRAKVLAANAAKNAPDLPNYGDPTQPDFVEHPAVKDFNDKLRHLSSLEQGLISGSATMRNQFGQSVPMPPEEVQARHKMLRATIQNLVNQRSAAVENLRKAGVRVAQAPDDTMYVGTGAAVNRRVQPMIADEAPDETPEEPEAPTAAAPMQPRKKLDDATARMFLRQAGGDNNKARQLATAAGYDIQ